MYENCLDTIADKGGIEGVSRLYSEKKITVWY